jgi:hypothetical protein
LASLFGFLDIEFGDPDDAGGWTVTRVKPTRFGLALLRIFEALAKENDPLYGFGRSEPWPLVSLRPLLQSVFPEWTEDLPQREAVSVPGTFVLQARIGGAQRRFSVPSACDFESLAAAILASVDFDEDHLYRFELQSAWRLKRYLNHEFMEDKPYAAEIAVGEVGLEIGDRFVFRFDFGDNWEFEIEVRDIIANRTETIQLIHSTGKPPTQYRDFDEDWQEDDW